MPQLVSPPSAAIIAKMPSIVRQLRRREGTPRKRTNASSAPPLAPIHPRRLPCGRGRTNWLVVAAVVASVIVAVVLVVVEVNVTVVFEREQLGGFFAFEELEEVREQASVTVPAYPSVELTVSVEEADVPAETEAGVVADSENVEEEAAAVTVTVAVPVAEAYWVSPL